MEKIEINTLKKMFKNGFNMIAENFEIINDLNVFPVPDGDTGTNLKITTSHAWEEINNMNINSISSFGKLLSRALLMNARGNSGVIFSQIIKGFVLKLNDDINFIDVNLLIECVKNAKIFAYDAVSKPMEGTILTVIRETYETLESSKESFTSVEDVLKCMVEASKKSLNNTPNLLEQLKMANVVDSGGYGLWCFFLGMYKTLNSDISQYIDEDKNFVDNVLSTNTKELCENLENSFHVDDPEKGFGYCSELIIKINSKISPEANEKKEFNFNKFKAQLLKMGESLVCIQDNDIVKVHLHTLNPGQFLTFAQKYGEFVKIKIENMTEQFYDRLQSKGVKVVDNLRFKLNIDEFSTKPALIITSPSEKISNILINDYDFKNILTYVDVNPSIEEIFLKVQEAKSKNIILVIDDKNILLAANQVKGLLEGKINLEILVTSNVMESLVCSLDFDNNISLINNYKNMTKVLKSLHSVMISTSTKDIEYPNLKVKKDDFISIYHSKIIISSNSEIEVLKKSIDFLAKELKHPDILILFYNNNDEDHKAILSQIEEYASSEYNLVCDFKDGGQKVYNYYICIQ